MIDETTGEVIAAGNGEDWDAHAPEATYRRSAQIEVLFAALCKAQATFTNAEKAGENPHFRSRYATLEAVLDATKQGRAENGLAVIQMPTNRDATSIGVTTLLGHVSGQWIESTIWVPPAKLDAQGAGSVITYLRRYALMAILGIAAEDDDGEAASKTADDGARRPAQSSGPANPNQLASQEQRVALWGTILRTWGGDKDEARKKQAREWLDGQFMALKPAVLKPTDLTIGGLRVIMEKVQEFARTEAPQEEPPDEPDDEFGFGEPTEAEAQRAREEALRGSDRRATEQREADRKKGKGKK